MTWIKICGTTNLPDALAGIDAGADALGFIFAPSPRRMDVDEAAEIIAALAGEVEKIGIVVNETPAHVAETGSERWLDWHPVARRRTR